MRDLTQGSIVRNLLQTSALVLVGMVFQTLYFLVDLEFVGMLGKQAVAAVSLAGNLMFVVLALTQMLGVGTTALIAQATGRKEADEARLIFNQSQVLSSSIGLLFLCVMMALREPFARAQSADAETAGLASDYLSWFIPTMALQFAMVATTSALRGIGDFKPGMIVQAGTVLLNVALAPVLMFGWGTGRPLGVAGTAIASFISVTIGLLALTVYVARRGGHVEFVRAQWAPRPRVWRRMLGIGMPAGAEFALMGLYMFVVFAITRKFGAEAQAGFGIGLRVIQAGFMPVVALGFAVSPVAAQNFGARLADRVRATFRLGLFMATVAMFALFVICQLVPNGLVRAFNQDPGVVAVGGEYLSIVAWNFVPSGIVLVTSSMFQALGNTIPPLLSSLARTGAIVIPAYLMSFADDFSLRWIWELSVGCVAVHALLNVLLLQREYRRKLTFADPVAVPSAVP